MEAKDSLVKIVKAMTEIAAPVTRQTLTDFLIGKETRELQELHLDDLETYGIGETHDEDYWTTVIDAAYEQGFLKEKPAKSETLVPSAAGKKFAKKPTSFEIDEEDENFSGIGLDKGLDELVLMAQNDKVSTERTASAHTKQQIKIIKAVDRKIALDDFAETESMSFNDVLDELESLVRQGRRMDITYFTNEILGPDCMEELLDFFASVSKNHIQKAIEEFGDVYSEEEIRLAHIVYLVQQQDSLKK